MVNNKAIYIDGFVVVMRFFDEISIFIRNMTKQFSMQQKKKIFPLFAMCHLGMFDEHTWNLIAYIWWHMHICVTLTVLICRALRISDIFSTCFSFTFYICMLLLLLFLYFCLSRWSSKIFDILSCIHHSFSCINLHRDACNVAHMNEYFSGEQQNSAMKWMNSKIVPAWMKCIKCATNI